MVEDALLLTQARFSDGNGVKIMAESQLIIGLLITRNLRSRLGGSLKMDTVELTRRLVPRAFMCIHIQPGRRSIETFTLGRE